MSTLFYRQSLSGVVSFVGERGCFFANFDSPYRRVAFPPSLYHVCRFRRRQGWICAI